MIFLDTNLLWWIVHPQGGPGGLALRQKVMARIANGEQFAVAEVCDYEARRELIRKNAKSQLARLDQFIALVNYVPLTTPAMRAAAHLWANARIKGTPTSAGASIDGDVILAAQAMQFRNHTVVTKNLKHLSPLCNAMDWQSL